MKKINLLILLLSICIVAISTESCKKDESCPTGYTGNNCEDFDPAQIQALLDEGKTPLELVTGNVPINSLYGKIYEGGLIFYLNTKDGTGLIAAMDDQSSGAEWGCSGDDIIGLNNVENCPGMGNCVQPSPAETDEGARIGDGAMNTNAILAGCNTDGILRGNIAAKLCRNLGADWFLPSRGELNLMYTNLHTKDTGEFENNWYWSSTESDKSSAWFQLFNDGSQSNKTSKTINTYVRAARAF